jgi:protein-tyrosine kinase
LSVAKFRDSAVVDVGDVGEVREASQKPAPGVPPHTVGSGAVHDRSIGAIIAELRDLTADQVEAILARQREKGVRFGEAAVELGFASKEDVLFALSQQFHYPYAPKEDTTLSPELVALSEPFGMRAESFRALRSQVMMRLFAEGDIRRAVAVISPNAGDGKTYCAANLAVSLAQLGGRTLLVDADMRGPRVHELFQVPNRAGLSGILAGRSDNQVIQQVAGVPSLFILPVGIKPPNPLELIERPAFGLLMRELSSKFDYVVVDTPAAMYGADASVIAARCGAALVVARKDKVRVATLQDMVGSLAGTPAKVAGVVLNDF